MIKDDFEYSGDPKPEIWVKAGSPYVSGGLLILPSAADMVRSRSPIRLDNGATIKIDARQGTVMVELSTYSLTKPPSSIEGLPHYGIYIYSREGQVSVVKNGKILSSLLGVHMPGTVEVEVSSRQIAFYVSGVDGWGRAIPRTKIVSDENQFPDKEAFIYMYGGGGQVDAVVAQSGYENPAFMVLSAVSSITMILPLLLFIIIARQLKGMFAERGKI
ncbi:MAG: hypothetical protein QXO67_00675 [Candidatus Bathyarchaeia archaeon]